MPFSDLIISVRERMLDLITGAQSNQTLNTSTTITDMRANLDPAADLQALLQNVLAAFVDPLDGSVDYAALRIGDDYAVFRACVAQLQTFDPPTLSSREEKLAFWINLYNTLIVDAVIALDVKRSIAERWAGVAFLRQAAYIVGGQRMSCDDIEHGILRGNRGHPFFAGRQFREDDPRRDWVIQPPDARVHFALNCASRSCPPIRVYAPGQLEEQLDLAARHFIAHEVNVSPAEKEIHLSAIFNWFSGDFGKREGVIELLLSHLTNKTDFEWLKHNREKVHLHYTRYDWRLNGNSA